MNLKLLWYCTKSDLKLYKTRDGDYTTMKAKDNVFGYEELNGKIVAESDYELMSVYGCIDENNKPYYEVLYRWGGLNEKWLKKESRLNHDELVKYLGEYKGLVGKVIDIWFLNKFEQPKELKDFYVKGAYHNAEQMFTDEIQINGEWFRPLKKAPQNMCYAFDKDGNKYVVISVHPEWLAMILNGLKTIEVRKKVLKEML
jgi:hypothetical protein